MYNLDVIVDGVEKETRPVTTYRHNLRDEAGWYVGTLRLPEALPIETKLVIQVMLDADIDYMANEAERNARDGYCGKGEYND